MTPGLLDRLSDPDVEDLATRLVAAIIAVVEFGRTPETDHNVFEPAVVRSLIACLAAWIAHPHHDDEQHQEALSAVIERLRTEVKGAD